MTRGSSVPAEKTENGGLAAMSISTQDITEDLTRPSDRTAAIRAELLGTPYSICLERPRLLGEFRRSRDGRAARVEHPLVRRAMALAYMFSHRRPRIYPGELIIGNMTSKRVAANYYIEGGSVNILEDVLSLEKKATVIEMPPGERVSLVAIGLRNLFRSIAAKALLRPGRFRHFLDFFMARRYFITEEAGIGHQCPDYHAVVSRGLKGADDEAVLRLETGTLADGTRLDEDRRAFFRSVRITVDGIRRMAANLADEAERQAARPGVTPERKAELLASAEMCRRVPCEPAAPSTRRSSRYGWCTSRSTWRISSRACPSGASTRYSTPCTGRTSRPAGSRAHSRPNSSRASGSRRARPCPSTPSA